jgi:hypothetical protein
MPIIFKFFSFVLKELRDLEGAGGLDRISYEFLDKTFYCINQI